MAYNDLSNMLVADPWLFDPSQMSNQFSNYNNQRMPGPTYANAPVNAATGQPIQGWQQQNPGGVTLNQTPAQPQQTAGVNPTNQALINAIYQGGGQSGGGFGGQGSGTSFGSGVMLESLLNQGGYYPSQAAQAQPAQAAQAQPNAQGQNWQAYLNALSNPGRVVTPGATVPQATGSQPSGGINASWLQGIGSGQGMNQNFVNALRNIQGRPQ